MRNHHLQVTPLPRQTDSIDLASRRDEQLVIARVRDGDALALETVFVAFHAELVELAAQVTGARTTAEDAVQEVFLAIWTGRSRWTVTSSLRGYLRRAVHNAARRSLGARERHAAGAPLCLIDASAGPDAHAERAELGAAIHSATSALPPRARDVLALSREHELSNREIAAALGISVKTVEAHITRAFALLRDRLAGWR